MIQFDIMHAMAAPEVLVKYIILFCKDSILMDIHCKCCMHTCRILIRKCFVRLYVILPSLVSLPSGDSLRYEGIPTDNAGGQRPRQEVSKHHQPQFRLQQAAAYL